MTTNKKNLTPNQQSLLFQTVFFVIFICIVLWLLYYNFEHSEHYTISLQTRSIEKDGFCVLYNPKYINLFDPDLYNGTRGLIKQIITELFY